MPRFRARRSRRSFGVRSGLDWRVRSGCSLPALLPKSPTCGCFDASTMRYHPPALRDRYSRTVASDRAVYTARRAVWDGRAALRRRYCSRSRKPTGASPAMTVIGAAEIASRLESSFTPGLPLTPPPSALRLDRSTLSSRQGSPHSLCFRRGCYRRFRAGMIWIRRRTPSPWDMVLTPSNFARDMWITRRSRAFIG